MLNIKSNFLAALLCAVKPRDRNNKDSHRPCVSDTDTALRASGSSRARLGPREQFLQGSYLIGRSVGRLPIKVLHLASENGAFWCTLHHVVAEHKERNRKICFFFSDSGVQENSPFFTLFMGLEGIMYWTDKHRLIVCNTSMLYSTRATRNSCIGSGLPPFCEKISEISVFYNAQLYHT